MCDHDRVRTAAWPIGRRRCLLASAYARIGLAARPTGRGKLSFAKGSTRRRALASRLGVPAIVLVVLAGSAQGQSSSPAWIRCAGGKGISTDGQIAGCTIVIQSGRQSPQNLAKAFSNRGTAFFTKGDYRRAIQDGTAQVINLDPSNATALDNRCWTRATLGLVDEPLQDCDQSLKLRPNHASTLATRGFVHLKSGRA